jgi:hypothetical protein
MLDFLDIGVDPDRYGLQLLSAEELMGDTPTERIERLRLLRSALWPEEGTDVVATPLLLQIRMQLWKMVKNMIS